MTVKNKLVRNKVPQIIEDEGFNVSYRTLDDDEYLIAIGEKLREKVEELIITNSIENMADICELVAAFGSQLGFSKDDLIKAVDGKNIAKGTFENRIYLEWFDRK